MIGINNVKIFLIFLKVVFYNYTMLKRSLLPLLSGLLLCLAFPKPGLSILAWIALVPLFFIITKAEDKKESFRSGVIFGIAYFGGTLYWIYHSIHYYGGVGLPGSFIAVLLLSLYLSLYTGLFSYLFFLIYKKTVYPAAIIAPSLWVVLEYLRTYLLTGFPWSLVGYTQYKLLPLIQIADLTGVYGISFLVVAVNGAIIDLLFLKKRTEEIPFYPLAPRLGGFIFLSIAILLSLLYGYKRLNEERPGEEVKVTIIQGNIPQDKKWEPAFQNEVIDIYKGLTKEAVSLNSPQLVVWPETAIPFIFRNPEEFGASNSSVNELFLSKDLVNFVRELEGPYLLFGSIREERIYKQKSEATLQKSRSSDSIMSRYFNSAFLLNRDGKVTFIYDKIHLVPFGEYVPLRKLLFFIDKITTGIGDYSPGKEMKRAISPFGNFSALICYEIIFPGLVRKAAKGVNFIVNITNDAWFGKSSGPYQHFSMAVFRAIENRKPVIRAANTGISGFIDSNGRILLQTPLFERLALTMNVRTDKTSSFYTKYGDLFVYVCILITITAISKIVKI
jgi:apolipoprotein N-acyltransferase